MSSCPSTRASRGAPRPAWAGPAMAMAFVPVPRGTRPMNLQGPLMLHIFLPQDQPMRRLSARWRCIAAAGVLAVALPVAAQTADAAARPAQAPTTEGTVAIRTIAPDPAQPLIEGQRVRITVEVAYTQPGRSATLALSLQDPLPAHRPLGAAVATVQDSAGRITLSAEVLVPAVPTLNVYVPLYTRDGVPTAVVDTRSYRVRRQP